jgi:GNAT superfamily N-acetyltransferase
MVELEQIERAAFRSMWQLAPEVVAQELGIASAEIGGATCVAFRAPTTMLNRALGVGIDRPVSDDDVQAIMHFFTGRAARFAVPVAPTAQPESLEEMLRARGFDPAGYAWMKFRRGTHRPGNVATDLHIEEIGSERAGDFGAVAAEAFELPPTSERWLSQIVGAPGWHCFVGYAGHEPAAAGALYVDGAVAWLGVAGTRPQFRGRGAQGAILAARIATAKGLGVETLVTETGERVPGRPSASYRNILRAGFEEAYLRPNYEKGSDPKRGLTLDAMSLR